MTTLYARAYKIAIIEYFVNVRVKHIINLLAYRKALVWSRRCISITSRVRGRIY